MPTELSLVVASLVAVVVAARRLRQDRGPRTVLAVLAVAAVAALALRLGGSWPAPLRIVGAVSLLGWGSRVGWPDREWPPGATSALLVATWGVASALIATAVPTSVPFGRGAVWVVISALAAFVTAVVTLRFDRSSTRVRALGRGVMTATVAGLAAFGVAEGVWEAADNFGRNGWEIYDVGRGSTPDAAGRSTWRGVFGRLREFAVPIERNAIGFRDRDHDPIPGPEAVRFAVLGDSFVEALQVPLDRTLTSRLEQRLAARVGAPAEGLAFGRSGRGLASHRDLLASTVLRYRPRLVVVCFLPGNDLRDDSAVLTVRERQLNGFRLNRTAIGRWARARRLQLAGAALVRLDRALAARRQRGFPFDHRVYRVPPLDADWAAAWVGAEAVVGDLQRLWREAGTGGVLVVIPSKAELEAAVDAAPMNAALSRQAARAGLPPDGWDYRTPARRMGRIAAEAGIPVLDLGAEWSTLPRADREALYWRDDGHWTVAGHERAAAALDRFLAERPELLAPRDADAAP